MLWVPYPRTKLEISEKRTYNNPPAKTAPNNWNKIVINNYNNMIEGKEYNQEKLIANPKLLKIISKTKFSKGKIVVTHNSIIDPKKRYPKLHNNSNINFFIQSPPERYQLL